MHLVLQPMRAVSALFCRSPEDACRVLVSGTQHQHSTAAADVDITISS